MENIKIGSWAGLSLLTSAPKKAGKEVVGDKATSSANGPGTKKKKRKAKQNVLNFLHLLYSKILGSTLKTSCVGKQCICSLYLTD